MKIKYLLISLLAFFIHATIKANVPSLLKKDMSGNAQLIVNGKPYLMIAGELHNSSASTAAYLNSLWPSLKALNLNTVLAAVTWEQVEPQEGVYDFTTIDNLIEGARSNGLNVVILWFGSWKNGQSSYAPEWVKRDTKRFTRVRNASGEEIETLSPFCDATKKADAKAYASIIKHIKRQDSDTGTVIAIQPENEVGLFQDIDYSATAQDAFKQKVPSELITYMSKNSKTLHPLLLSFWQSNGCKKNGTWIDVFGDNMYAKNFFMAWAYGKYVDYVAKAGKNIYPIPTFCNAWLVQHDKEKPGDYPNGGPVAHVMDIWKASAPNVDVIAPDIYLPKFKAITSEYKRHDNPLLIPEATLNPANAFWAFGEHGALCYSPFGIEEGSASYELAQSNLVLKELTPYITKYRNTNKMFGIMNDWDDESDTGRQMRMGDYIVSVEYDAPRAYAYGMVIQIAEDEFLVAGVNFKTKFSAIPESKKTGYILRVEEGGFDENGNWTPFRILNGDETFHHSVLMAKGRKKLLSELQHDYTAKHNEDVGEVFVYSPESYKAIYTPAIYRVKTYMR